MTILFFVHVLTTLMVTGMMWFVQVVHYPLLRYVGQASFSAYETAHTRLAIILVVSLMVIESVTGLMLLVWRPQWLGIELCWVGLALLAIIWWSTFCLQVPQHRILASGFNAQAYQVLVRSNWIRTGSYSARALLVLWMLASVM